jgi:hypothetical protein
MKSGIVALLAALLVLPSVQAWSQSNQPMNTLTEPEWQTFDNRLKAARTDQERAAILAERDNLARTRSTQSGDVRTIPASPDEIANDPIMSDVPTPRSNRSWSYGTLPGGALAPTGTGTGPSPTTGGWGWSQ